MARSAYVYVVANGTGHLLAAFTVKHELLSWLARPEHEQDRDVWVVVRVRDGVRPGEPVSRSATQWLEDR